MPADVSPVLLAIAGLGVGFVVGLTGMGGGALLTPLLVLLFGIDPTKAVGSDLVVSLIMKPLGGSVHLRRGTVHLKMVLWLSVGSVPAAFSAVWMFTTFFGDDLNDVVKYAVGAALLLASLGLVLKGAFATRSAASDDGIANIIVRPLPTVLIGIFGGLAVGITSVGSGSLMVPLLLMLYPLLTSKQLVGTDLVQAVPLVAAAALGHAVFGSIELSLTVALLVGALPGVWIGAHVSSRAPDHVIRPLLAVVLIVSGLKMLGVTSILVGLVGIGLLAGAATVIVHSGRRLRAEAEAESRAAAAAERTPTPPAGSTDDTSVPIDAKRTSPASTSAAGPIHRS